MKRKFRKNIQGVLNKLFLDEEYHEYTLGEVLEIAALDITAFTLMLFACCL